MTWSLLILPFLLQAPATPETPTELEIVHRQLAGAPESTLEIVDREIRGNAAQALDDGIVYLRGHLLEKLNRSEASAAAFTLAADGPEMLRPFSLYHLARIRFIDGRGEEAVPILTGLLRQPLDSSLAAPATSLLLRSLADAGECDALDGIEGWPTPRAQKRRLRLARADCALAGGDTATAAESLKHMLHEDREDGAARLAAERLVALPEGVTHDTETTLLLGSTFYHHREFDLAIELLERGLAERYKADAGLTRTEFNLRYALARSYFWQGRYDEAAERFGALGGRTRTGASTSKSLFQRARSLELKGVWDEASAAYLAAYRADTSGDFSGAALISAVRLEWRSGREEEALGLYRDLRSRSQWGAIASRAALFLAASDIVRNRADRAAPWLETALARSSSRIEARYWLGRLSELQGDPGGAVEQYFEAARLDPYHPLGQAAATRLATAELRPAAVAKGERLAASQRTLDLQAARLLLTDSTVGREATAALRSRLLESSRARTYLDLQIVAPSEWPIWRIAPRRPQEMMIRLGIWSEVGSAVQRHFPLSDPDLALTGSHLLSLGAEHRRSLYVAEILDQRRPEEIPADLMPEPFRRLLYPLPWPDFIFGSSADRGVDPHLLAGILREESRFEATAVSAASARGLGQFVFTTAQRLAAKYEIGELMTAELAPGDLDDPAISIALGAAYLGELAAAAVGLEPQVLAGYNAGENQAELWLSYCYSREPEEYFTKVSFRESRNYLRKVLTSRAHYRELYPPPTSQPE